MFELYAYPDTYSIGCHMLLEESGVEYRVSDISQFEQLPEVEKQQAHRKFIEASPHGRVPAIRFDNGSSLCESGAIALHLADSLCDGAFSVSPASPDRPQYLQWLFYLSSTLQPEVMLQFHPEHYFESTTSQAQLKTASMERLTRIWSIIESQYHHGPWMFDNRPTAVDFSLATVLLWPECFPDQPNNYPNLSNTLGTISQRSACSSVIDWHKRKTSVTGRPETSTRPSGTDSE